MTSSQQIILKHIASEIESEGNDLDKFDFGCQMALRYSKAKRNRKTLKILLPSNSIEARKKAFYDAVAKFLSPEYPKTFLRDFYDYWTEIGEGQKKMLFEREHTFEISKRLARRKRWLEENTTSRTSKDKNTVVVIPQSPFRNIERFDKYQ